MAVPPDVNGDYGARVKTTCELSSTFFFAVLCRKLQSTDNVVTYWERAWELCILWMITKLSLQGKG